MQRIISKILRFFSSHTALVVCSAVKNSGEVIVSKFFRKVAILSKSTILSFKKSLKGEERLINVFWGWVKGTDGILVEDKNHDGKINDITETISEHYTNNVADGLEALKTLTEAGVKEINLAGITAANKERNEGNIIFSKTTYTTTTRQIKQVAAVGGRKNISSLKALFLRILVAFLLSLLPSYSLACDSGYLLVNRVHYNSGLDKKSFGGLCYRGEFIGIAKKEIYDGLPPVGQTVFLNLELWYNNIKRPMLHRNNGVIMYCKFSDAVSDVNVSFNLNNRSKNYSFGDFYPCPGYKDGGGSFVNKDVTRNTVLLDESYNEKFRLVKIISYHEVDDKVFALIQLLNQ